MTRKTGLARWWRAAADFEPQHLFYETHLDKYYEYEHPEVSFFGTTRGFWTHRTEYTRVGEWFRHKPFILYFLVGALYYPWAWPLWWFAQIFVFGIPSALFTKWDD